MNVTRIVIRELETAKEVHSFTTTHTGATFQRMLDGLDRRVDLDKYYVDVETGVAANE